MGMPAPSREGLWSRAEHRAGSRQKCVVSPADIRGNQPVAAALGDRTGTGMALAP